MVSVSVFIDLLTPYFSIFKDVYWLLLQCANVSSVPSHMVCLWWFLPLPCLSTLPLLAQLVTWKPLNYSVMALPDVCFLCLMNKFPIKNSSHLRIYVCFQLCDADFHLSWKLKAMSMSDLTFCSEGTSYISIDIKYEGVKMLCVSMHFTKLSFWL